MTNIKKHSVNSGDSIHYENITTFIQDCTQQTRPSCPAREFGCVEFYGTQNFAEAVTLWQTGWTHGTTLAAKYASDLLSTIQGNMKETTMYLDTTTNYCWDMASAVAGVPQCGVNFLPEADKKLVSIGINIGARGGVDKSVLMRRAASIGALITCLQIANMDVKVTLVNSVAMQYMAAAPINLSVVAHAPGQELDLSVLAYCLGHPSFFRRLVFNWREYAISLTSWKDRYAPGWSQKVATSQYDIYLDAALTGETEWQSDVNAVAWITETLKQQGVSFGE